MSLPWRGERVPVRSRQGWTPPHVSAATLGQVAAPLGAAAQSRALAGGAGAVRLPAGGCGRSAQAVGRLAMAGHPRSTTAATGRCGIGARQAQCCRRQWRARAVRRCAGVGQRPQRGAHRAGADRRGRGDAGTRGDRGRRRRHRAARAGAGRRVGGAAGTDRAGCAAAAPPAGATYGAGRLAGAGGGRTATRPAGWHAGQCATAVSTHPDPGAGADRCAGGARGCPYRCVGAGAPGAGPRCARRGRRFVGGRQALRPGACRSAIDRRAVPPPAGPAPATRRGVAAARAAGAGRARFQRGVGGRAAGRRGTARARTGGRRIRRAGRAAGSGFPLRPGSAVAAPGAGTGAWSPGDRPGRAGHRARATRSAGRRPGSRAACANAVCVRCCCRWPRPRRASNG